MANKGKNIYFQRVLNMKYNVSLDEKQRRLDTGLSDAKLLRPLTRIYDRVVEICKEFPPAKANDNILVWRYIRKYHPEIKISFRTFLQLKTIPSFESITRMRRKAVEKHDIDQTPKTRAKRKQREQAIRYNIHEIGEPNIVFKGE